ncbi:MAG TPA: heparan-alpha-glucosaminide N-acetyltransferase domain-containing protein, partial [Mizugakiibacter sp.]
GFNFALPFVFLQVIWAIGLGMVAMAALTRLPTVAVLALGVLIVAGHDAFASVRAGDLGAFAPLWTLAMTLGPTPFAPGFVAYPAVPWFGILCLGVGLGPVFLRPAPQRRRLTVLLGLGCLALFVALRLVNGYGDPAPWHAQAEGWRTVLAFFDVSKYPPSLLYVLVMLGTSLLLALGLERLRGPLANALLAYGRTPLFTYLLHIYLVHGLAIAAGAAMGVPASAFCNFIADPSRLMALHWGFGLPVVYAIWFAVLAALYPASRWYAEVRRRRRDWWLSYL